MDPDPPQGGRPGASRPAPEPLETDDRAVMAVGTVVALLASALALAFHGWLSARGHGWWFSACMLAVALGLIGLWHETRRARRRTAGRRRRS